MMELIIDPKEFENYFAHRAKNVNTSLKETKAYILGIFNGFIRSDDDFSKESITLKYISAKENYNFVEFQKLGDWIFLVRSTFPKSLKASEEYYDSIARISYYRCYLILDKKWPCFEELADRLDDFIFAIRPLIRI